MNPVITVILAVLVFGFLIFIHEFGHYIFARIFKVKINEFSIGMGPKLVYYDSKKTGIRYALSMFPIGGYVAMAGEDSEDDDPNAFDKKPAWQRFIITIAGASVNIIAGFLAMIIFTSIVNIGSTKVAEFVDSSETGFEISSYDSGLRVGDTILEIDGKKVSIVDELSYEIMRRGNKPVDVKVERDGVEMILPDVVFPGLTEQGQSFGSMDFKVYGVKDGELTTTPYDPPTTNHFRNEINAFVDSAINKTRLPSNIDINITTSKLMQALYDSAESHREIVL